MTSEIQKKPTLQSTQMAEDVSDFSTDRGMFSYSNMGEIVRMGELMSASGGMVPAHCRGRGPVCAAIAMQAATWGMSPFALAQESYVVKDGAPVAYGGKVFIAVAKSHGMKLRFEYTGSFQMTDKAATSGKGNQTARRTAVGDLQCTCYCIIDGEREEYTTPKLDDITIKNSPLWHNDPKQQLSYYAARNFMRLHAPEMMLGVMSNDEAAEYKGMKDVTPKPEKTGFAALAEKAKQEAAFEAGTVDATAEEVEPTSEPENGATVEAEAEPAPDEMTIDINPKSKAFEDGYDAGVAGFPSVDECPLEDENERHNWVAGYRKAQIDIEMGGPSDE